jgi:dihydropteroate synthase
MSMNGQFLYVQLKFTQKIRRAAMPMPHQREVVIEVPRDLLQSKQSHLANDIPRERIIAIDLARRAALSTFPTVAERAMELYEEDLPILCENRFHVMNERPCDYDENGTRVWRLS